MNSRKAVFVIGLLVLLFAGGAWLLSGLLAGGGDTDDRSGPPERQREEVAEAPDGPLVDGEERPDDEPEAPEGGPGGATDGEEEPESPADGPGPHERPDLTKETAWSVAVRVVDADGKSLEAKVRIILRSVSYVLGELPRGEEGLHTGYLPEPGGYLVEAEHEGTRKRAAFEVDDARTRAEVEIRFTGSGVVSGRVYSAAGSLEEGVKGKFRVAGQADLSVEFIPVARRPGEAIQILSALVDASGSFRIGSVPAGDYVLRITAKFYAARVSVGENEHVVHDVRLSRGRISGRVTDRATGEPLQNVQVVIALTRSPTLGPDLLRAAGLHAASDRLSPDETGFYAFTNLPPGEYRLFSNGAEHAPERMTATVTTESPDVRLDFALERGSSVDIAVLSLEGEPLEGPLWLTQGIRCGFTGHVVGLRVGKHDFIAYAPGHELQTRPAVEFLPGEPTKLVFKLARAAETRLIFRGPDGGPVAGVRVGVWKDGRDLQPLIAGFLRESSPVLRVTGNDGSVRVLGVRAGPVRVVAKISGFALFDETIELSASKPEQTVTLEPAETEFVWRVRITRVQSGGQADRLGLRVGDVLVSLGDVKIGSVSAVSKAVQAAKASGRSEVELVYERAGEEIRTSVTPGVLGVGLEEFEVE